MIKGIVCLALGIGLFLTDPLHQEQSYFKINQSYTLSGEIESIQETEYYKWVTLKQVSIPNLKIHLKSKINLRMNFSEEVSKYDWLTVKAKNLEIEPQMNPSDFDYETYLKGEDIVAQFKVQKVINYQKCTPFIERIQTKITQQLKKLYTPQKLGIMEAALLGEDSRLDNKTKMLYQKAGISHVLCISGFHVGVIMGLFLCLFKWFPIPYEMRQLIMILAIWGYALLTGCATSTVRATLMATVVLMGRFLWQEDDPLTSLALAAMVILWHNPYQLFMVGFQLSFMAVLGIILCMNEITKKELRVEWKYPKWQSTLLIWLSVQLLTWPVMVYHFYEMPLLISLLNLILMPIFSFVIITGWWTLLVSFMVIPIAYLGSHAIEMILAGIEKMLQWALQLPLATICIGRPSILEYSLYIGGIIILGMLIWGYCSLKSFFQGTIILATIYISSLCMQPKLLKLTCLYIGQGDCMVIQMPNGGVFILDGGPIGKGKVIENYLKYLGCQEIEGIMVSHSDADHMGGILELIHSSLSIKQVFVSEAETPDKLQALTQCCKSKKIPICYLAAGECLRDGKVSLRCVAPEQNVHYEEENNNSLVCHLNYGHFSALFTGDQSKELGEKLDDLTRSVTLLKVSHHGSRTGTSSQMLLKLKPRYAMISCGRRNVYGHPHQEVVALLEEAGAQIQRTDEEGAISYETDGIYIKETSYRKDA